MKVTRAPTGTSLPSMLAWVTVLSQPNTKEVCVKPVNGWRGGEGGGREGRDQRVVWESCERSGQKDWEKREKKSGWMKMLPAKLDAYLLQGGNDKLGN
jgi:hypothetical protein